MSKEKHDWLIANGLLNPDGTRPDAEPPVEEGDATAQPDYVVAEAVDPNQGG
jgi:hypothetical protein